MKHFLMKLACAIGALLVLSIIMTGCGGNDASAPVTPSELTGVRADGAMDATLDRGTRAAAEMNLTLNPSYANAYLAPERLSVALTKFELMKSADDETPYVVFTATIDDPKVVDLTDGASASFGENAEYPDAGTYTHVRLSIVYFQTRMSIDEGLGQGVQPGDYRLYASTVGNVLNGDVLALREGKWYWNPGSNTENAQGLFAVSADVGPRPDSLSGVTVTEQGPANASMCVQDFFFSEPDTVSSDPYIEVFELPQPIVVPASPTGQYRITAEFNVTQSPIDPNATGMFMFDDVDGDGIFEPGPGSGSPENPEPGRDCNDGTHGEPIFSILPPAVSLTYAKVD